APILLVVVAGEIDRHSALAQSRGVRKTAAHQVALGAVLPAVAVRIGGGEAQGAIPAERLPPAEVTEALGERAAADRDVALRIGLAGEDLHHAGERRDAVHRALWALDHFDAVDVLDRNLGKRGIERPADRDAVQGEEQGVELLESPHPYV